MGYDGNGNFLRIHSWVADAAAGIKIRSDRHDAEDDNFADGLSNALTRDGQSQPTADIPMNEYKIIALGAPTDPADAATKAYVDSKKTYTNDIEVTDQVIFKDGPTTRGTITGQIGSTNPAAMIFEINDSTEAMKNRLTLNEAGLSLLNGALSVPGAAGVGSLVSSGQISGTKGVFTSNIDVTKTLYFKDGAVQRGYIDYAIGAGVGAAMTIEIDNDAAVMVNRMAMNSTGFYLANGHITVESGGGIFRGSTGLLLTSSGASPQIRGSMIADVGAAGGTVAIRSYNSSGVQDALFYINQGEAAIDRNTFSITNANDQAVWFKKADGNIRGAVYNFQGGSTDIRAYNTSTNALINLLRVGSDRQMASMSYGMTWNSDGTGGDVFQNHRVSSTRATRLYFSTNGDWVMQQSDDNFGSSFINCLQFVRSNNSITTVGDIHSYNGGHTTGSFGKGIHFPAAGAQASLTGFNFDGIGLGYSPRNNVEVASWWGFGVRCLTDGYVRWAVDTRNGSTWQNGDVNIGNAAIFQDGNMKFAGTMVGTFGQYLSDALGQRGVVYTGGGQDDTVFPISHQVLGQTGDGIVLIRNSAQLLYLSSNYSYSYTGTTGCGGSWRMRGGYDSPGSGAWSYSWERVA